MWKERFPILLPQDHEVQKYIQNSGPQHQIYIPYVKPLIVDMWSMSLESTMPNSIGTALLKRTGLVTYELTQYPEYLIFKDDQYGF